MKPLDAVGVLEDAANAEFNHDVVRQMNNIAVGSFLGAGLEVIDMETVFGVRVDGHPASYNSRGAGDALHYCSPGVQDVALDVTLRSIFGATGIPAVTVYKAPHETRTYEP